MFTYLVGPQEDVMTVPRALAEGVSDPLHTMMNNENMEECQNG